VKAATARALLVECRPLFVAETVNPCLKESGRESARHELAELDSSLASASLAACQDSFLHAVALASFSHRTPAGRGLAGRVRRFAVATWPADYTALR
jgi:hypothetical protein